MSRFPPLVLPAILGDGLRSRVRNVLPRSLDPKQGWTCSAKNQDSRPTGEDGRRTALHRARCGAATWLLGDGQFQGCVEAMITCADAPVEKPIARRRGGRGYRECARQAWTRRKDDLDNLKPCNGTRWVANPTWQSWPAARTESCVDPGQPGLRSVDRECIGRVMEPR